MYSSPPPEIPSHTLDVTRPWCQPSPQAITTACMVALPILLMIGIGCAVPSLLHFTHTVALFTASWPPVLLITSSAITLALSGCCLFRVCGRCMPRKDPLPPSPSQALKATLSSITHRESAQGNAFDIADPNAAQEPQTRVTPRNRRQKPPTNTPVQPTTYASPDGSKTEQPNQMHPPASFSNQSRIPRHNPSQPAPPGHTLQYPFATPPGTPKAELTPIHPVEPPKPHHKPETVDLDQLYAKALLNAETTNRVNTTRYQPGPSASPPHNWKNQLLKKIPDGEFKQLLTKNTVTLRYQTHAIKAISPIDLLESAVTKGWRNQFPETLDVPDPNNAHNKVQNQCSENIARAAKRWVQKLLNPQTDPIDALSLFTERLQAKLEIAKEPYPKDTTVCHAVLMNCFPSLVAPESLDECIQKFRENCLRAAIDLAMQNYKETQKTQGMNVQQAEKNFLTARGNHDHYYKWFTRTSVKPHSRDNLYNLPREDDSASIFGLDAWCTRQQTNIESEYTRNVRSVPSLIDFMSALVASDPSVLGAIMNDFDNIMLNPSKPILNSPQVNVLCIAYALERKGFVIGFRNFADTADR